MDNWISAIRHMELVQLYCYIIRPRCSNDFRYKEQLQKRVDHDIDVLNSLAIDHTNIEVYNCLNL